MVGGFVMLAAFVLVWFLKEVPLSDKSGLQRRRRRGRHGSAVRRALTVDVR